MKQLYLVISRSDFVYLNFNYFMEINLKSSWKSLLCEEINQPYFVELMNSVEEEYSKKVCNSVEDALSYIRELTSEVNELQAMMPYSEIVNDLDTVKSTLNSAKYKLKFLK